MVTSRPGWEEQERKEQGTRYSSQSHAARTHSSGHLPINHPVMINPLVRSGLSGSSPLCAPPLNMVVLGTKYTSVWVASHLNHSSDHIMLHCEASARVIQPVSLEETLLSVCACVCERVSTLWKLIVCFLSLLNTFLNCGK